MKATLRAIVPFSIVRDRESRRFERSRGPSESHGEDTEDKGGNREKGR